MDLEEMLQKIVATNHLAMLDILKEEDFDVESFHRVNTDLKEIGDVHYSFKFLLFLESLMIFEPNGFLRSVKSEVTLPKYFCKYVPLGSKALPLRNNNFGTTSLAQRKFTLFRFKV